MTIAVDWDVKNQTKPNQGYQIVLLFQNSKNNNFVEFKVHLIHGKQVPLIHNTVVLILCYEGDGLSFFWFDSLHPSQQLWSCRDGQFT